MAESGFAMLFRRRVVAVVALKATEIFAIDPHSTEHCNLQVEEDVSGKHVIKRVGAASDRFKLPFYGRVIEEAAAAMASRPNVLPLTPPIAFDEDDEAESEEPSGRRYTSTSGSVARRWADLRPRGQEALVSQSS